VSRPQRQLSLLGTVLAVLAIVLPVALGAALYLWQRSEQSDAQAARDAERELLSAATLETMAWASVDYRKVDEYFGKVEAGATGDFLTQFKATEKTLRTLLVDNESVQVPTIPKGGVGLIERNGSSARVLVAMDATVSNKSTKSPQPRQYRIQLTLNEVKGKWLVSNLEFVS